MDRSIRVRNTIAYSARPLHAHRKGVRLRKFQALLVPGRTQSYQGTPRPWLEAILAQHRLETDSRPPMHPCVPLVGWGVYVIVPS